jgi:hypothetical protein
MLPVVHCLVMATEVRDSAIAPLLAKLAVVLRRSALPIAATPLHETTGYFTVMKLLAAKG